MAHFPTPRYELNEFDSRNFLSNKASTVIRAATLLYHLEGLKHQRDPDDGDL